MRGVIIFCLAVAIVHGQSQEDSSEEYQVSQGPRDPRKAHDCQRIARLFFNGIQTPLNQIPHLNDTYQKYLGVSGRDLAEIRRLVCSLISAKTIQEVADKVPATYDQVKQFHDTTRAAVISRDGYTGYYRSPQIRSEVGIWAKSKGFRATDTKISSHVDLQTFTNFMESMQVKFGSYWLSALIDIPYGIVVNDIKKFARDLFESKTDEELHQRSGIDKEKCNVLINAFGWQSLNPEQSWNREQIIFRVIELIGRNGLLNLQ